MTNLNYQWDFSRTSFPDVSFPHFVVRDYLQRGTAVKIVGAGSAITVTPESYCSDDVRDFMLECAKSGGVLTVDVA